MLRYSLACALLVVASACKQDADDDDEATASTTAALQAQSQAGITDGVVDTEGALAPDPEEAAKKIEELPLRGIRPEGCATKKREGATITLTLDKCTGPFGKVVVTGTYIAKLSKTSADVLHVDVAGGEGTIADGRPITYSAQADVRFDGNERFLTYHGQSSGTTRRGQPFTRKTDLSIVADIATKCAAIDGVSKGTVGRYDVNLTIEGLKGCRDACPTAGLARATVDGPLITKSTRSAKNASVEVRFDGTDRARVKVDTEKKKRNLVVELDCDAAEAAE